MRSRTGSIALALLVLGCAPAAYRTGPGLVMPSGPAQSRCEATGWYEVAPARVVASGQENKVIVTMHYSQELEGLALFRPGSADPELLEDAWPNLRERELEDRHRARIEPVESEEEESLHWALLGLAGMVGGVGLGAALYEPAPEAGITLGVAGILLGVTGAIGSVATQPSGPEKLQADARRRLFIQGEDDLVAVRRGVERNNAGVRASCGTRPR